MIEADGQFFNRRWGYLSRAGVNDKSQLMRQIEKYADIYTSRVSNFLRYTPFEVGWGGGSLGLGLLSIPRCVVVVVQGAFVGVGR
jgi:hypothetical protein